ncbi:ATP-binding cassette domain-containing protein [Candidatus Berkiella cookevillensis]|uniref:ATP-binding cassette domain-containing protein n=2 Tax=Candidatus Berkiella cookevillensis TaxID=437022 RepID=A0A0Q9YQ29_9GAMM|nr:ATP-binding cassette domain-containing protein [Candidatus Berkiella cookevillensis]MCS5707462.1 ATP-binding cassette domain-containing protein [Candidatus Berkiella cookevillensis]
MLKFSTLTVKAKVMVQKSQRNIISIEGLGLSLGGKQILQNISFALAAGEIVSLIGPNGAGKSSLVKCIVGLLPPTTGTIHRHQPLRMGYMPQSLKLDPSLPISVKRFLTLGQSKVNIDPVLAEVGVQSVVNTQLTALSGGEWQRVLLARALLRQPNFLVLDEPAQGVDLVGQDELYQLIAQIRDRYHCAVLLVSHDLNLVMAKTDKVLCLNQHICCFGTPQTVGQDPSFLKLFGKVPEVALYAHKHDHQHDVHGEVVCRQGHKHDE